MTPEPPGEERYSGWMRAPLVEAEAALLTGDVPVGAVVVDPTGVVIGRGRNVREAEGDPTGHAEVRALRAAAATRGTWRLDGASLVVTLEPCTMCAGALVLARVSRLVFGAWDPKAGAAGPVGDGRRGRRGWPPAGGGGGRPGGEDGGVPRGLLASHRAR